MSVNYSVLNKLVSKDTQAKHSWGLTSLFHSHTHTVFDNKVFLVHFRSKVSHCWICVLKYILQKPCRKWAGLQYHCCQNECEIECSLKFHRLSVVKRNRTKRIVEYFSIFHKEVVLLSCVAMCTHKIHLEPKKALIENIKYFYLKLGLSYCNYNCWTTLDG